MSDGAACEALFETEGRLARSMAWWLLSAANSGIFDL